MPIPDYQSCMLPLLKLASDGKQHRLSDAIGAISGQFKLSKEEREALLPSGTQFIIGNRVGWARTYLKKAGLLNDPKRGYFEISDRGRDLLKSNPPAINTKFLQQFPEFNEFQEKSKPKGDVKGADTEDHIAYTTPEEALDYGYQRLTENLSDEISERIKSCSPEFFERLVVELLVKMGYGGSLKEAAEVVGKSGDEGIDGIIKEDKLGLDTIYVQAKRWQNVVSRPEIQKFAGALLGKKARRGIFITTSAFTKDAVEYAENLEAKIVLLDGERLAKLMIEHGLGVNTAQSYEIKRIDSDYFSEEM